MPRLYGNYLVIASFNNSSCIITSYIYLIISSLFNSSVIKFIFGTFISVAFLNNLNWNPGKENIMNIKRKIKSVKNNQKNKAMM